MPCFCIDVRHSWGGTPTVAMFAEVHRYKRESFRGTGFAPRVLADNGIPVVMKVRVSRHGLILACVTSYDSPIILFSTAATSCTKRSKRIIGVSDAYTSFDCVSLTFFRPPYAPRTHVCDSRACQGGRYVSPDRHSARRRRRRRYYLGLPPSPTWCSTSQGLD